MTGVQTCALPIYDEYCHGGIDRREFLHRASLLTIGGVSALAMAQALLPRYALAQTISFTDQRIKARYVTYPSPGGTSGTMRGYLVQPNGPGPFPAVLVIHENRGLNPYIEDVARRVATEGFLALAPDGLSPVGGYPGNDDDGRTLQGGLEPAKLRTDMVNGARFLKAHALSAGKLGVTGFCWGGGTKIRSFRNSRNGLPDTFSTIKPNRTYPELLYSQRSPGANLPDLAPSSKLSTSGSWIWRS